MNPISQLARKIRLAVSLGVMRLSNDANKHQTIQATLLKGEVRDHVNRMQQYGYTSNPLDGAEVALLAVGGNRNHMVAIAVDDPRYRKKGLAKGEAAMYHHQGDYILMKNGRIIEVVSGSKVTVTAPEVDVTATTKAKVTSPLVEVVASTKVTFTSPLVEMSGNLAVAGTLAVNGNSTMQGNITSQGTIAGNQVNQGSVQLGTHVHGGIDRGTASSDGPT